MEGRWLVEVVVSRCRLWNLLECTQAMRESSCQLENPRLRGGGGRHCQVRGVEPALSLLLFQGRSWHQKAQSRSSLGNQLIHLQAEKETQA